MKAGQSVSSKSFLLTMQGKRRWKRKETQGEREIKVGVCLDRKTWVPFAKKGKPANDDPRKRQPCTSLPKPKAGKKLTGKDWLWKTKFPEMPATHLLTGIDTKRHADPDLKRLHAVLSLKARRFCVLKSIQGKIFKYLEEKDGSVEHFKRLGLWDMNAPYPTGAHSKLWSFLKRVLRFCGGPSLR